MFLDVRKDQNIIFKGFIDDRIHIYGNKVAGIDVRTWMDINDVNSHSIIVITGEYWIKKYKNIYHKEMY